jgi:transposase
LLKVIEADANIPTEAKDMLALLGNEVEHLDDKINDIEVGLMAMHKSNPVAQLLATIPGIGVITALTIVTTIDPTAFKSGRHLAAWIGLTPKEHSTAGRQRMGGISRAGNERLRQLLVIGATAVIKVAVRPGNKLATEWLLKLLQRRPRKLAAVALANKMARMVWAVMTRNEAYRRPHTVGVVSA